MRSTLNILLLIIIFSFDALSQVDKVYLKNGSIIYGKIDDVSFKDSVKVRTDHSNLKLAIAEVDEIKFYKRGDGRIKNFKNYSYTKGFDVGIAAGTLFGDHSQNYKISLLLEGLLEYKHSYWLNPSVGGALNFYDYYHIMPVFLQNRVLLQRKSNGFYLFGKIGKGVLLKEKVGEEVSDVNAGLFYGFGVGYQKRIGANFLRFQVGSQTQSVKEKIPFYTWWWRIAPTEAESFIENNRNMNRIMISTSLVF